MSRAGVSKELVLLDWNWLHEVGYLKSDMPGSERVKLAAPRMGMKPKTLECALKRAGVRWPRPEPEIPAHVVRPGRRKVA